MRQDRGAACAVLGVMLIMASETKSADATALSAAPMMTSAYAIEGQACQYAGDTSGRIYGNGATAASQNNGLILSCQSGVWKKISLGLQAKDTQSGPAGAILAFEGVEPSGLSRFCNTFTETIESTAMLVTNLQQVAYGTGAVNSYIDVLVYINGNLVGVNYATVVSTGSFGVSTSITEVLKSGTSNYSLCVRNNNVTAPTVNYSVSLVQ